MLDRVEIVDKFGYEFIYKFEFEQRKNNQKKAGGHSGGHFLLNWSLFHLIRLNHVSPRKRQF